VKDEMKVILEIEDDALCYSPHPRDEPPLRMAERRVEGANEKGARHPSALQRLIDDAATQMVDVNLQVR
jgi:hypothetical protein